MLRIAILGATGLVGQTILKVLEERQLPVETLVPLATEGQGRSVHFNGQFIPVERVDAMDWSRVNVAFFAATNAASAKYAPEAIAQGVTVIDKSSHFRMDPTVPLVVPEINVGSVGDNHLIASPNCSTIQMVAALNPIRMHYGLERIIVSTYQAVSGTGREAMTTLRDEIAAMNEGQSVSATTYPYPIGFNILPYCDRFMEDDYTGEEWKLTRETQKIFNQPVPVSATAVRVPVQIGHAESVYVETAQPFDLEDVKSLLQHDPSIRLVDDPRQGIVPTPLAAAGQDLVWVGRVRKDLTHPRGLHLFVVADNLRKGAATNAIQIMEALRYRWE